MKKDETLQNVEMIPVAGVTADELVYIALILLGLAMFFAGAGMRTYRKRGEPMLRGAVTGIFTACAVFTLVFIITATIY